MRKTTTKRALLASALSLFLCFAMLLGTTFAWFTDSVTSANNIIVSGNLDIELEYWNDGEWVDVSGKSDILTNTLWEPGVTEVAYLRIANAGTLALKYMLGINVVSETAGVNKAGDPFNLSDYIQFGVVALDGFEPYANREAAVADLANAQKISAGYTAAASMPAGDELYLALVVYMPTTVGNEANHKTGTAAPEINLGINIVATQVAAESDAFNDQYDVNAPFPTASSAPIVPGAATEITLNDIDSFMTKATSKIPSNAAVKPGTTALTFTVTPLDKPHTGITIEGAQQFHAYDIDIVGLENTASNSVEMTFQLAAGLSDVAVYHYNEVIPSNYDAATGVLTFAATDFSPYTFVYTAKWDGSVDTSWYNDTDTEFVLTSTAQFAGFAQLCNAGNNFEGKTIMLAADVDLYLEDTSEQADGDPVTFRPIGDYHSDSVFSGTFDGQGHTIYNLYQNGWDLGYEWGVYGSYGLFGIVDNATIKNLTISGAESYIEGGDVGGIAGSATGTCVFENITIEDSVFATYNNGNGGIVAWSGEGDFTFKNIKIADDVVLAGLWGSFDSSIGGIVGQGEPGSTYNFENVEVACRLDAYNDCTASYDYYNYRMCGMLIGRLQKTTTIDGTNYPDTSKYNITCKNVTVTYGEWANYHYCRTTGARAQRVEAGYSYGGLSAEHDHSTCTAHCMELIAFDQIFGGDQYAVKGLKTYDGVTVVYNNH